MSNFTRRDFMKRALIGAASIPLIKVLGAISVAEAKEKKAASAAKPAKDVPLPPGAKAVPESDPLAQALGYKENVKNIDFKKYPNRKKPENQNQFCDNCSLYVPSNEGWGKCQMIQNGLVKAKGWCGSWNKKA